MSEGRWGTSCSYADLNRGILEVYAAAFIENIDVCLKLNVRVGGLDATCGGQSTDTAFVFGNGAEGGVAVEPEAVFHGWPQVRRKCLPGGTQWSGSRAGATCRSGWNQAFLTELQRRKKGLTALPLYSAISRIPPPYFSFMY